MKLLIAPLLASLAMATPAVADQAALIKVFQFQPKDITVKVGTKIIWTNGDDIEHSVTAGAPGKETKTFDSGFFKKDGTWEMTFSQAGTFEFFCKRHPSMKGKVIVTE